MLNEFLNWYLAPWRRLGRKHFNIAVGIITSIGFIFSMVGWVDSVGGVFGPISHANDMLNSFSGMGGQVSDAVDYAEKLQNFAQGTTLPAVEDTGVLSWISWGDVLNNLLLLMMIPLVRMRLHDMGKFGNAEWVWLGVAYGSVASSIINGVGISLGLVGFLLGGASFIVWMWLCMAPTKRRGEEEASSLYERAHGVRLPNTYVDRQMTDGMRSDKDGEDKPANSESVNHYHDPYR